METDEVASKSTSFGSWSMLAVLLILYTGSFIDRLTITMLVPAIKEDLQLTDFEIGLIVGPAFAVFYVLFSVPFGWAADRFERRRVIFFGSVLWAVAAFGSGLSSTFLMLLLCRFGIGAGEASLSPAAYSLMADKFPKRRLTLAMAIYQIGSPLGTAFAFVGGGLLIGWTNGLGPVELPILGLLQPWQLTLVITATPFLFLPFLAFTFAEPMRIEAKRSDQASVKPERQNILVFMREQRKVFVPMIIGFAIIVVLVGSLLAWVPTYITRQFGISPDEFGGILGITTALSASTLLLKGWVIDWLFSKGMHDVHLRFFTWMIGAALPISVVAFLTDNFVLFLILYGALQILISQFMIYAAGTIQLVVPQRLRGQVLGFFMSLFGLIGFGAGPLVTATITDYVFGDEGMLGYSLLIVSVTATTISWIALRKTLAAIRARIAKV